MSKAPAFQFYANEFLAGRVATYSLEEIGAYTVLLAFDWSLNGLPKEPENLAKLCRISRKKFGMLWETISEQFEEVDGKLYNPRLAKEREKQRLWREKSAAGGRARHKGGSATPQPPLQPKGQPKASISSSTSVTTTTTTKTKAATATAAPWVGVLLADWSSRVGAVRAGQIGAMLKPAVTKHGLERVQRAMWGYIAAKKSTGHTPKLGWFAGEVEVWVERTASPIAVVDGVMTDTLELLTRPDFRVT